MWRTGILKQDGTRDAVNFKTKEQCEEWILEQAELYKLKKAIYCNKENFSEREIITF